MTSILKRLDKYQKQVDEGGPAVFSAGSRKAGDELPLWMEILQKVTMGLHFFFFIVGSCIVAIGGYSLSTDLVKFTGTSVTGAFIAAGVLIFLFSFIGCFGAYKKSRCFIAIYLGLMAILLILQLLVTAFAFAERKRIYTVLQNQWQQADLSVKNDLEGSFGCCGFNKDTVAGDGHCDGTKPYCADKIVEKMQSQTQSIGIIALILLLIQILGVAASYFFYAGLKKIKRNRGR